MCAKAIILWFGDPSGDSRDTQRANSNIASWEPPHFLAVAWIIA